MDIFLENIEIVAREPKNMQEVEEQKLAIATRSRFLNLVANFVGQPAVKCTMLQLTGYVFSEHFLFRIPVNRYFTGCITQLVTSLTADPGVPNLIPAWSHTSMEIDHEIISSAILLLPLIQEGLLSVTSESMCIKYWLTA